MNTLKRIFPAFGLIILLLFVSSCKKPARHGGVVEFTSSEEIEILVNLLSNYWVVDEGKPAAAYLSDNMVLWIDNHTYVYQAKEGNSIEIQTSETLLFVNGTVRSIRLTNGDAPDFEEWFASATPESLGSVQSVEVDQENQNRYLEELIAIARANPNLSLGQDSEPFCDEINQLVSSFMVRLDAETTPEQIERLDLSEVRILVVDDEIDTETFVTILRTDLPSLEHLMTSVCIQTQGFLDRFPMVSAISLYVDDVDASIDLSKLQHLRSLCLLPFDSDIVVDLNQLPHPENLRYLSMAGTEFFTAYETFARLEYLHPGVSSLADLEGAVAAMQEPVFLNLIPYPLRSLKLLEGIQSLEGVAFGPLEEDFDGDFTPLTTLKRLKYVGLYGEDVDPAMIEEIRTLCPGVLAYHIPPLCLGSGWLLLVAGLTGLAVLLRWYTGGMRSAQH